MTFETWRCNPTFRLHARSRAPQTENTMTNQSSKGVALVTGASAGIGAIYADRLARRGFDLILVARNQERLSALANKLTTETGRGIEIVAADLNNKADLAKVERILRDDASITLLVNNAGVGAIKPLL